MVNDMSELAQSAGESGAFVSGCPVSHGTGSSTTVPLGPESLTWKYFGDWRGVLQGPYAGSMQNMHPQLGAAVEQHSLFFRERWQRLLRSLYPIGGVVFDGDRAPMTGAEVRDYHVNIKGVDDQGRRYSALNPDVFYWAHATFFMGTIVVEKATKTRTYDMIDYMNGGLSLNQVLMIDFTQSNGSVKDPSSLHFFDPKNTNQYEAAIQAIGSALFQYDRDAQIPVYGFGAKMPIIGVNDSKDFFYIQTSELAYASSIPQALKLYESAFEYIELAGPCRLSPGIKSTAEWVKGVAAVDHLFYAVLLILTDGEVEDMEETKEAIVEASVLPMSIIIVGLRGKNHSHFKVLDGDLRKLRDRRNRPVYRDIVQYVDYSQVKTDKTKLDEEVLAELPHQIVEYFTKKKIRPSD